MVVKPDELPFKVEINFRSALYTFCREEKSEQIDINIRNVLKSESTQNSENTVEGELAFNSDEKKFMLTQDQWNSFSVGFLRDQLVSKLSLSSPTTRLIYKGRKLEDDELLIANLFMEHMDDKKEGKNRDIIKIMLIASKEEEVKSLKDFESNEKVKEKDLSSKRKGGYEFVPTTSIPFNASYGFTSIETLPGLPNQNEARKILTTLANDPGVLEVMKKRGWKVPILAELYPDGSVGEDPVCVLGLNVNHGEKILLRIRTDDLSGFRKLRTVKETLYHELAHNQFGPHDEKFYRLMREITKESDSFNLSGRTLSGTNGGVSRTGQIQGHIEPTRYIKRKIVNITGGGGKVGDSSSSSNESSSGVSNLENLFSPSHLAGVAAVMRNRESKANDLLLPSKSKDLNDVIANNEEATEWEKGENDYINNNNVDIHELKQQRTENLSEQNEEISKANFDKDMVLEDIKKESHKSTPNVVKDDEGVLRSSSSSSSPLPFSSSKNQDIMEEVDYTTAQQTENKVDMAGIPEKRKKDGKNNFPLEQESAPDQGRKDLLSQLIGMGFDAQLAEQAIKETASNMEAAIEYIVNKANVNDFQYTSSNAGISIAPNEVEPNSRQHRLMLAVEELKIELNQQISSGRKEVLETLIKIIDNIMQHPEDIKYQKFRKNNANFQKRIASYIGAINILKAIGFEEQQVQSTPSFPLTHSANYNNIGEPFYVLTRVDIGLLWLGKQSVETLLE